MNQESVGKTKGADEKFCSECGEIIKYSIRINDQWKICFYWNNGAASEVEISDYH